MKSTSDLDLLLALDRTSGVSLRLQLEQGLREAIRDGRLPTGLSLPSTRSLADSLEVSRGVVVAAYEQLIAEGYVESLVGSGTRVADVRPRDAESSSARGPSPWPTIDFRPGMPELTAFPKDQWLRCVRRTLASASREALGYPDPLGAQATRAELAAYLGRSRATSGGADRVVMCNGFTQGIDLVARLLRERKVKSVAVEDPGFGGLVQLFQSMGMATPRIPVDARGLMVERLAESAATAVVVTPAHQFPTGSAMTPDRRGALLAWAAHRDALIVEDDYDAEFRYDREPVGALQGLAPDHVIYIGTTSKTLSPALRLGWLLAPRGVVKDLARLKRTADRGSPTLDQIAFGEFIATGQLERHLRKMRAMYRTRRDALIDALRLHLPTCSVHGVAAGLHMMVTLPEGIDERALVAQARNHDMRVWGVHPYHADARAKRPALLLGYGGLQDSKVDEGARLLALLVSEQHGGRSRKSTRRGA